MRLRELPGWASALEAARRTWPWVADDVWRAVGERDARDGQRFVASCNELYASAGAAGLDVLKPR